MNLDLYTLTAFIVGILAGVCAGFWLARFITGHTVERLERKVHSLSDSKFELKGSGARLRQLEQRLDSEAAKIPVAERELNDKSGEIKELTAALTETTALTSDLTTALRARKAKVQQLQLEQSKWMKRNKALLLKSEATEAQIAGLTSSIEQARTAGSTPPSKQINGAAKAKANAVSSNGIAAPALAAGHHINTAAAASGDIDSISSRLQKMEADLQTWFERVGKLEANATGQMNQASGLALLEQVLRGEAENQDAAAKEAMGGQ